LPNRYGRSWQIVPAVLGGLVGGSGPARALWVMAAVLNVKKLDFVPLESAYDD
jgi:predicted 3-demethylubiquinone-9 3-methyltransferase (glyoxalase superfamily)